MSVTCRFIAPPHHFDAHTHRIPTAHDTHTSIYNLPLPTPEDIPHAMAWLTQHPWAMVSIGIHPWDSGAWSEADVALLLPLLAHPQVVAIGECGLDRLCGGQLEHQIRLFIKQAQLATNHPLIIHCVKAQAELLSLRREFPNDLWIVHGFRGKPSAAQQLWQKGIATSFGLYYHPDTLSTCPPHLCYHETDDSTQSFHEILMLHAQHTK